MRSAPPLSSRLIPIGLEILALQQVRGRASIHWVRLPDASREYRDVSTIFAAMTSAAGAAPTAIRKYMEMQRECWDRRNDRRGAQHGAKAREKKR